MAGKVEFYTYGDTDEPDVSEQTKPIWDELYALRRRIQELESLVEDLRKRNP
jgi:hypothetical protein